MIRTLPCFPPSSPIPRSAPLQPYCSALSLSIYSEKFCSCWPTFFPSCFLESALPSYTLPVVSLEIVFDAPKLAQSRHARLFQSIIDTPCVAFSIYYTNVIVFSPDEWDYGTALVALHVSSTFLILESTLSLDPSEPHL